METNWYNNDLFWKLLYPFLMKDEMVQQAQEQVGKIFNLVYVSGKSILVDAGIAKAKRTPCTL